MNKVIMIVVDGLSAHAGRPYMGYMQHLVEQKIARYCEVQSELPSNSRPLYETLMTGLVPHVHGVTHNYVVRKSLHPNLFSKVRGAGGVTAASAYYFFSELYNRVPFDPLKDKIQIDSEGDIAHGIFYYAEAYPDGEQMADSSWLLETKQPDFMLVHPMMTDTMGHLHGGLSDEYVDAVRKYDDLLSLYLPAWLEKGYSILITADHGMGAEKDHGGDIEIERRVPLWLLGSAFTGQSLEEVLPQVKIAPMVERALGI